MKNQIKEIEKLNREARIGILCDVLIAGFRSGHAGIYQFTKQVIYPQLVRLCNVDVQNHAIDVVIQLSDAYDDKTEKKINGGLVSKLEMAAFEIEKLSYNDGHKNPDYRTNVMSIIKKEVVPDDFSASIDIMKDLMEDIV
jgi:hypothetical protein